jgi:hypothetical protein
MRSWKKLRRCLWRVWQQGSFFLDAFIALVSRASCSNQRQSTQHLCHQLTTRYVSIRPTSVATRSSLVCWRKIKNKVQSYTHSWNLAQERTRRSERRLPSRTLWRNSFSQWFSVLRPIISTPCFEVWLLLHFRYCDQPFRAFNDVLSELHVHLPDYSKADRNVFLKARRSRRTSASITRGSLTWEKLPKQMGLQALPLIWIY